MELTILMPCLNEARTLPACIAKARAFIGRYGVQAEILVSDNGSTDGSPELAAGAGARVVHEPVPGYGASPAVRARPRPTPRRPPGCRSTAPRRN